MSTEPKIITYTDPATQSVFENIVYTDGTIWMTQKQIGKLYGKAPSGISMHIKKIYEDGELSSNKTHVSESKFRNPENTQNTFKKPKKYYNLQMIIAIGFKVNSPQASSFRTRANTIIDQYSKEGYALDDERLKGNKTIGGKRDYDKLMDRVRVIRFNERDLKISDWVGYLDKLLDMNKLEILADKGLVSRKKADEYVKEQMALYQKKRGSLEAYIEGAQYLMEK